MQKCRNHSAGKLNFHLMDNVCESKFFYLDWLIKNDVTTLKEVKDQGSSKFIIEILEIFYDVT